MIVEWFSEDCQVIPNMNKLDLSSFASLADHIAAQYGDLPQIQAVALGGSQATQASDLSSDLDLYVYWQNQVPVEPREAIAKSSADRIEVNNQFWETGDEWIDRDTSIHVDVMFRHTRWIEGELERVLDHHQASVGYSTCLWHNVLTSRALFDRSGWFAALKNDSGSATRFSD